MFFSKKKLQEIVAEIDLILIKVSEFEEKYQFQIKNVHPNYTKSATNLIHYLALRSFDINVLQEKLDEIGLPSNTSSKINILQHLLSSKAIINGMLNIGLPNEKKIFIRQKEARKILNRNSKELFGDIKNKRKTAIMVTQSAQFLENDKFFKSLFKAGMDCVRINCSHDNEIVWQKIIKNIKKIDNKCKIMMDLGGPKIRTGKMKPGPKVIHIKPKKNVLGKVIEPAKIWLAPYGVNPPKDHLADAKIPVNKKWLNKTKKGSFIIFRDSRNKKCKILIEKKEGKGRWASCSDSAFITTGTLLNVFIEKKASSEIHTVHELLPLEEIIFLSINDYLRLDKKPILGEPAAYNKNGTIEKIAHISCTLPEMFDTVQIGEQIYFNDGKIEGIIEEIKQNCLIVKITNTSKKRGKLKADKGINLPNSDLKICGLTKKDKIDLKFIVKNANAVNLSFVNNEQDVQNLLHELKKINKQIGIIVKIETKKAFENLPSIILKSMENYPVGVMIARGDLAVETGWKNFAVIQEEILQLCEAAHIPSIWATQVLENLTKKGIPTRAGITDAAMAERAECVMLNKGVYIEKSIKMLDKIISKMQTIQMKKGIMLPKLVFNQIPTH